MIAYAVSPWRVDYGMTIESYIEELFEARKFGNRELLVVNTSDEVMGCITGPKLLRLYLTRFPKKVCQLTKRHYEDIHAASQSSLTRKEILKIIVRKKRSLFVFKKGTRRSRFSNTVFYKNIESEINRDLAELMMKGQKPNYLNLKEYNV